ASLRRADGETTSTTRNQGHRLGCEPSSQADRRPFLRSDQVRRFRQMVLQAVRLSRCDHDLGRDRWRSGEMFAGDRQGLVQIQRGWYGGRGRRRVVLEDDAMLPDRNHIGIVKLSALDRLPFTAVPFVLFRSSRKYTDCTRTILA